MVDSADLPSKGFISAETWQLAVEVLPTVIGDEKGTWTRPVMAVVVGAETGFCYAMDMGGGPQEAAFDVAARALGKAVAAARDAGADGTPVVQLRDPELATAMRGRTEFAGVNFDVVDALNAVDFMLAHLRKDLLPSPTPSLLEQPGMSVERLSAFADGAAAFYAARPWRELHDDDLIEIHSPPPPKGMRFASILGAGGQVIGVGFFPTLKAYDELLSSPSPLAVHGGSRSPRWSMMFHAPDELPPEEADVWEKHGLRTSISASGDDAVPVLLQYRGQKFDRPDAATLTFVEGLCRAVAAAAPADFDAGRWEKTVATFEGPVTYRLTIPHLLASPPARKASGTAFGPAGMERSMRDILRLIERSGAKTVGQMNALIAEQLNRTGGIVEPVEPLGNKERALDLCEEAQGQHSRRALQLIREALRLDPDCAEAYVMLAQRQSDLKEAEGLYRQGVEAGRRSLGTHAFRDAGYPFWRAVESRPFMRAMAGLADVLEQQNRLDDAAATIAEMLRLNPGDNQGVRYRYVPLLIKLGRLDEARKLIESKEYRDDVFALWPYAAVLITVKQGRLDEAGAILGDAARQNPWVIPLILNAERMPPTAPQMWSPGTQSEAVEVAALLGNVWRSDAEALRWLRDAGLAQAKSETAKLRTKSRWERERGRERKRKRRR